MVSGSGSNTHSFCPPFFHTLRNPHNPFKLHTMLDNLWFFFVNVALPIGVPLLFVEFVDRCRR